MTTIWISAEFPELEIVMQIKLLLARRYDAQYSEVYTGLALYRPGPNFQEQFLIMTMGDVLYTGYLLYRPKFRKMSSSSVS